ncbi:MAG: pilus assembly FimT family protein [Zhaonellaceae bacterium]|jgi:prepilin-type N-terminal cleavage/methylation domain-containing protein|nr:prepilin-type N-terminal cleavage/methylation domain-containing protein [Clostridia bacterium]
MGNISGSEKGFTYLEVIIAITIIGLFCTMALPAFDNIVAKERLKAAARAMTVHFREVQQLAMAEEQGLAIVFDRSNSYYVDKASKVLERKHLQDGITITLANFSCGGGCVQKKLRFTYLGRCTPGRVELTNSKGDKMYIIVNSMGRVRTSDIPPKD